MNSLYIIGCQINILLTVIQRDLRKRWKWSQLEFYWLRNRTIWWWVALRCIRSIWKTIIRKRWVLLAGLVQWEVLERVPERVIATMGLHHWTNTLLVQCLRLGSCSACVHRVFHLFRTIFLYTLDAGHFLKLRYDRHCLFMQNFITFNILSPLYVS